MAKFQVSLNGSNIVNKDRKQQFEDALQDQHLVDCGDREQITVKERDPSYSSSLDNQQASAGQPEADQDNKSQSTQTNSDGITVALDHTYTHQARTMEIHQQYLSQQAEYLELITAVLNQQGKVLDHQNGIKHADVIETFQRTLDNFHLIREKGLHVHQEFLTQQAAFSERYLNALEGGYNPGTAQSEKQASAVNTQQPTPAEWVVQVPPIVLDEHAPAAGLTDNSPDQSAEAKSASQAIPSAELSEALLRIVADKTGYPSEMLELSMDLEADLGIDSIKRVEILGALEDEFPTLPPADTEILAQTRTLKEIVDYMNEESGASKNVDPLPAVQEQSQSIESNIHEDTKKEISQPETTSSAGDHSVNELTEILLKIVAEKTGYPVEMLEPDMDMEADLGIDSIKRVEILGSMEEQVPGLPPVETEALAELRTLGQIVELMSIKNTGNPSDPDVPVDQKKKVDHEIGLENTPVKLVKLPKPDQLDIPVPAGRPVIITDEGTKFTQEIAHSFSSKGWKVVLWKYPKDLSNWKRKEEPVNLEVVKQEHPGKNSIKTLVDLLRTNYGKPSGFIHLHPHSTENGLFSDTEEQLMKQVFLLAGELKEDLNQAESGGRNFFLAVTRSDGSLGLKNDRSFQEGNGVTGLIKTLKWEWPDVFCRTIDFNPEMDSIAAGEILHNELLDPDIGLSEVGITNTSRVTIERENKEL